jgi:EAL domain-containing protein (putative c-di-GMP-specific phosphodiesterase class I)
MYRAKAAGRSLVVFFEERMNAEAVARLTLDRDLRAAIERGELALHYQPQLDLRSGRVRGAEALLRWNHPTHGPIAPLRFIPLAEESGFIETLGRWVVQQACRQLREWSEAGIEIERVAVNVSPRQFRKRTLVDHFAQCVAQEGIAASQLEIEVTEGLLMERSESVEQMLGQLAAAGHPIALDDFGTGFSSMSYLRRFPVNTIKIDRVFVNDIGERGEAEAIVSAIIAMSHALGKGVIAEGVETPAQAAILRQLQCDEIQGFHVARALPPAEFEAFFRARQNVPAPA